MTTHDDIKEKLSSIGQLALEDWGMFLLDPVVASAELFAADSPVIYSSVAYSSDDAIQGTIHVVATDDLARQLSANIVGSDDLDSVTSDEATDAIKELGNIVAGHYVTDLFGNDSVFELQPPNAITLPIREIEDIPYEHAVAFLADDMPVLIFSRSSK